MDKLFGEVDYVEAGEAETDTRTKESTAYSSALPANQDVKKLVVETVENR
jgi:hypothetical protein